MGKKPESIVRFGLFECICYRWRITFMEREMRHILTVIALLLFSGLPAFAQDMDATETKAFVTQAETYFNKVSTVKARFAQANNDGSILGGVFYWWRPSRMRFQYDLPNGDYIVADGLLVHYWDDAVKNYSNAPVGSTLADFLLRKKIKLSGDLQVVSARRPKDNRLILTIGAGEKPGSRRSAHAVPRKPDAAIEMARYGWCGPDHGSDAQQYRDGRETGPQPVPFQAAQRL
jgi:hypothetical protein